MRSILVCLQCLGQAICRLLAGDPSRPWQVVEKAVHGFFNIAIPTPLSRIPALRGIETSCLATWFSNGSHFQWLAAIKNDGTSLYRLAG
jgi:hypothetical protein